MMRSRNIAKALEAFHQHGGVLRTSAALSLGIHPAALYRLVQEGRLLRLARGMYRLSTAEEFNNPDLAVVAIRAPEAVVCLISALAFHGITTQVPRVVQLAVPRGNYAALRLKSPPVKVYRFEARTFEVGIEMHRIESVSLRVFSAARTLVDCFKYRNKIGLDVCVEALRFARERKRISNREILGIARQLRQERVMAPYLEAIT